MNIVQTQSVPIEKVKENRGQVPGLPPNPRKITVDALRKLVQSIRDYPGMLCLRELLVYPYNGTYVVIGGIFVDAAKNSIKGLLHFSNPASWCIITPPPRRHTGTNFAQKIAERLSAELGVVFHAGFAVAKNRDRLKPNFEPLFNITEQNIILYDDITTTGSTLQAMLALLPRKNVFTVVGIANRGVHG